MILKYFVAQNSLKYYLFLFILIIIKERINNNKSIDEFNKNALNIQLVDVH